MARILIASDDSELGETVAAAVAALGHEAVHASTGQDAYDVALATKPSLVLLDVNLPLFDGYEVCGLIRSDPEFPAALPIVLMGSAEGNARHLEHAGATAFFPKGAPSAALMDLLVEHLAAEAMGG